MNESGRLICIRRDSAGSEDGVCFAVIAKEDHWKELEVRAPWTLFLGDCLTPWADSPSQPSTKKNLCGCDVLSGCADPPAPALQVR